MPEMHVRVKTRPPYPEAEGVVRLVALPRPNGGFAVRMEVSLELEQANPTSGRSRTDPVFLADDAAAGFRRANEWLEENFEVVGIEDAQTD